MVNNTCKKTYFGHYTFSPQLYTENFIRSNKKNMHKTNILQFLTVFLCVERIE